VDLPNSFLAEDHLITVHGESVFIYLFIYLFLQSWIVQTASFMRDIVLIHHRSRSAMLLYSTSHFWCQAVPGRRSLLQNVYDVWGNSAYPGQLLNAGQQTYFIPPQGQCMNGLEDEALLYADANNMTQLNGSRGHGKQTGSCEVHKLSSLQADTSSSSSSPEAPLHWWKGCNSGSRHPSYLVPATLRCMVEMSMISVRATAKKPRSTWLYLHSPFFFLSFFTVERQQLTSPR